ncbi:hypothetical protein BGZ46_000278 [Entomortierella lignicola]|nr:hypothetical protein BGZ46_000278 [Entomortierella lignicola]
MENSVFDVPLLTKEIAQYLHLRDLAHCVLVSKKWNALFIPRLWREIDFKRVIPTDALIQHQEHIRTIASIEKYFPRPLIEFSPCNLQSLIYDTYKGEGMDGFKVLELVAATPSLQRLSFRTTNDTKDLQERIIRTLESHQGLQKLVFQSDKLECPVVIQRLIQACRHLRSLTIKLLRGNKRGKQIPEKKLVLAKENMCKMADTRLQELEIDFYRSELESVIVAPLIEHSPLLVRLKLPDLHDRDMLYQIAHILQNKERARLTDLRLDSIGNNGRIYEELFRSVGNGGSKDHKEQITNREGLRSLSVEFYPESDKPVIKTLPQYFADTLVDLNLGRFSFPIQIIVDILHRLPNLRSLMTGVPLEPDEVIGYDMNATLQTPWSCLGLTKLNLNLRSRGLSSRAYQPDWEDPNSHRSMEYLFSQVGRLVELEELRIAANVDLLALEQGCLNHLTGLKRLKVLDLESYRGQLTAENVGWMIEHWERLCYFMVSFSFIPRWFPGCGQTRPFNSAIEELQSRKPWLQIAMGGFIGTSSRDESIEEDKNESIPKDEDSVASPSDDTSAKTFSRLCTNEKDDDNTEYDDEETNGEDDEDDEDESEDNNDEDDDAEDENEEDEDHLKAIPEKGKITSQNPHENSKDSPQQSNKPRQGEIDHQDL